MTQEQGKVHDLRASDPEHMWRVFSFENLQRLANAVKPRLVGGERTLVYVLSMPSRIGHLALEPHALFNHYGEEYDRLVIVYRDNPSFPLSQGVKELASGYVTFATTEFSEVAEMGHHDGNIQDFGIFSFAIAAPQTLIGRFVDAQAGGHQPRYFSISPEMRARGEPMLRRLGITPGDKLIGFHARTPGTHANAAYHDYRNASLENYEPLLRYLLEQDYWVVRLGDRQSPDLSFTHPRLVDLPKQPDYQDFMDVVIADRSVFGLVGDSGPEAIFRIMGKPILRLNCAATHHVWLSPDDLLLLKNYRDRRTGQALGYRELLERGLSTVVAARDLDRHEVDIIENTADELLAAGMEMLDRLAGRGPDDAVTQARFREIGADFAERFQFLPPEQRLPGSPLVTCYGYGLPWTRHAHSYFEAHPGFLET
jgi:putative glycosyltransferase (TIGR04372 family)